MVRNLFGRFKMRLLIVIVLAAVVGLIMQSSSASKEVVEPVLQYIMETDYDIQDVFSGFIHIPDGNEMRTLPVSTEVVLKMPCDFVNIERSYGWHWSSEKEKQEFCPGMYLQVTDNTLVKPILAGSVEEVQKEAGNGTVRIKHAGNLVSIYGGLKDIEVTQGSKVVADQAIGKTGESFYFELRSQDGPVNPQSIFK